MRTCILCGKEITGKWYCRDCYRKGSGNSESRKKSNRKAQERRKNSKV